MIDKNTVPFRCQMSVNTISLADLHGVKITPSVGLQEFRKWNDPVRNVANIRIEGITSVDQVRRIRDQISSFLDSIEEQLDNLQTLPQDTDRSFESKQP